MKATDCIVNYKYILSKQTVTIPVFREASLPEMDGAEFTMLHSLWKNSKWMFVFNLLFYQSVSYVLFSIFIYI